MRQEIQGQQDLLLSEQNLQALVETIPALVWRARPDGHIDYVNKRVLEYFGAPLADIIGWGWTKRVHPDDIAFKVQNWLSNLERMTSHDANCRFQGADGTYRWFNVRGEPLRDSSGRVRNWYGVLIDIDDRRNAEDQLRRSEMHLSAAQRLSQTGSYSWKPSANERFWSDVIYHIFDIDPAGGPDLEKAYERIHPDQRDHIRRLTELQARGEVSMDEIVRLVMPDGSTKFIHMKSHAARCDDGGRLGTA